MQKTILSNDALERLNAFSEDNNMYGMLAYLEEYVENGMSKAMFKEQDITNDLELALWIAYADINIDEYERYLHAISMLQPLKHMADGCGVWYYRYAVCLLSIGKLEQALEYAEMGIIQEPDYPWTWLIVAELRSHFKNRQGAFDAIEEGLALVPNNYEFLTRKKDIEQNKTLTQMEMHFIDEEVDKAVLSNDPSMDNVRENKRLSTSAIECNNENLKKIIDALGTKAWNGDDVYCNFTLNINGSDIECQFEMNQASVSNLFDIEWAEEFISVISSMDSDARECIDSDIGQHLDAELLELVQISIYRSKETCFTYAEPDSNDPSEYIYVSFDINFDIDDDLEFGINSKFNAELYDICELDDIEEHITEYFGDYNFVIHELYSPDIHVDVCLIEPIKGERDYYTLVTCGMGAHVMDIPPEARDTAYDRAELFICLPVDWDIKNEAEEWYWPIRCLKSLARFPGENGTFFGWGHTITFSDPVIEGQAFNSFVLLGPQASADESGICELLSGERVAFYQVIPLYDDEKEYKLSYGIEALLEKMKDVNHVLDINRKNTCEGYALSLNPPIKQFAISAEDIKQLLKDFDEPLGCVATDRIMVDGLKVGYMYREEVDDSEYPDSGWRFTSGDEDDSYMLNPANSGIYDLNTICNYDPDIIQFLREPFGSVFFRNEDGDWQASKINKENDENAYPNS